MSENEILVLTSNDVRIYIGLFIDNYVEAGQCVLGQSVLGRIGSCRYEEVVRYTYY